MLGGLGWWEKKNDKKDLIFSWIFAGELANQRRKNRSSGIQLISRWWVRVILYYVEYQYEMTINDKKLIIIWTSQIETTIILIFWLDSFSLPFITFSITIVYILFYESKATFKHKSKQSKTLSHSPVSIPFWNPLSPLSLRSKHNFSSSSLPSPSRSVPNVFWNAPIFAIFYDFWHNLFYPFTRPLESFFSLSPPFDNIKRFCSSLTFYLYVHPSYHLFIFLS